LNEDTLGILNSEAEITVLKNVSNFEHIKYGGGENLLEYQDNYMFGSETLNSIDFDLV
jgi:hypothetical protein